MRRRHRGSSLFYEAEISGSVSAGGKVTSTGFVSGSTGWAIDGDGNVEFNSGEFRGSLDAATGTFAGLVDAAQITAGTLGVGVINSGVINADQINAGTLSADFLDGGTISGTSIDINSAFTVDASGNMVATDGTFTGTLTGTVTASAATITGPSIEGGTIDIGGADATSFHVDAAGQMWLGAATYAAAPFRVTAGGALTASGVTATGTIRTAASGTRIEMGNNGNDEISFYSAQTYPGAIEVGASRVSLYVPSNVNNSGHGPEVAIFGEDGASLWMSTGKLTINNELASFSSSIIGFATIDDDATEMYSRYGGSWVGRLRVGRGSGGLYGSLVAHAANLYTTHLGLFHSSLDSAYMIMSDGSNTLVGADTGIYLRPFGNAGGEVSIIRAAAGLVQVRGTNGTVALPTFTFGADTDTGMWLAGSGDLRFSTGGVLRFKVDSALGVQAYHRFFLSGLGSSSTTSGEPLWHFNAGGDEIYEYTSTGKLKGNQKDRPRSEARSILNLRPKTFDAKMRQRDGTVIELATAEAKLDPKKKGQIYDMVGLIAEDVAVDFPDACIYDEAGEPRNIDWNAITTSIIGLLQDMDERLDALEKS